MEAFYFFFFTTNPTLSTQISSFIIFLVSNKMQVYSISGLAYYKLRSFCFLLH